MKGEKRDLLVIGKSKNPRCFKGVGSLPVDYYPNANAWMTSVIFTDWLVKWDLELKRKIVLLVDNCTAHTNNSLLKDIKVIFLPANIHRYFGRVTEASKELLKLIIAGKCVREL